MSGKLEEMITGITIKSNTKGAKNVIDALKKVEKTSKKTSKTSKGVAKDDSKNTKNSIGNSQKEIDEALKRYSILSKAVSKSKTEEKKVTKEAFDESMRNNDKALAKAGRASEAQRKDIEARKKAGISDKQAISNDPKVMAENTKKMADYNKKLTEGKEGLFNFKRAMGALSILFLSQAIIANMKMLATSTISSFMKISQGATESGKAITTLSANFEYLKFTVGNAIATALMPLIPTITSIIEVISNFIQKHPKLTSMAIAFTGIAAMIGLAFAQIVLLGAGLTALTGSKTIGDGLAIIGTKFKNIGTSAMSAGKKAAVAFLGLNPILILLAILATLLLVNLSQYPDEVDHVKDKFKTLGTTVMDSLKDVGNTILDAFGLEKIKTSEEWAERTAYGMGVVIDAVGLLFRGLATLGISLLETFEYGIRGAWALGNAIEALKHGKNPMDAWNVAFEGVTLYDDTTKSIDKIGDSYEKAVLEGVEKLNSIEKRRKIREAGFDPNELPESVDVPEGTAGSSLSYLDSVLNNKKPVSVAADEISTEDDIIQKKEETVNARNAYVDSVNNEIEVTKTLLDVKGVYTDSQEQAAALLEEYNNKQLLSAENGYTEIDMINKKADALERENAARQNNNDLTDVQRTFENGRTIYKGLSVAEYMKGK